MIQKSDTCHVNLVQLQHSSWTPHKHETPTHESSILDLDIPPFVCWKETAIHWFSPHFWTLKLSYVRSKWTLLLSSPFFGNRIHFSNASYATSSSSSYVPVNIHTAMFDSRVQHYSLAAFIYCVKPINRTNFLGSTAQHSRILYVQHVEMIKWGKDGMKWINCVIILK